MHSTTLTPALLLAILVLVGCGGASSSPVITTPEYAPPASVSSGSASGTESGDAKTGEVMSSVGEANAMTLETARAAMPAAPWALPASVTTPRDFSREWSQAENHDECAALLPASAPAGARARALAANGGWAVEFDKNGAPGMLADGRTCRACGRAAFGVAGTAMSADSFTPETSNILEWADGSRAEISTTDDGVGSFATLTVPGQTCAYQVWSFLGEGHLKQLLADLRFSR